MAGAVGEVQAVLAQFVVQGFARDAQGFGEAAHRAVRAGQLGGDQAFFELLDLLASAETLLAATGNAVALCPTYGTRSRTDATTSTKETR